MKTGIIGFALIAVSYGLARFSWGLMMPAVAQDIPFNSRLAGILSACSFAAYCLSISAAATLNKRYGPRFPSAISALSAALGLLLIAAAASPVMLGVGLFIAGSSAGFSSPSLAAAVSRCVSASRQTQVNTLINAGTGAGIILSVPLLSFLPWRIACLVFAVIALLCLWPVQSYLPRGAQPQTQAHKGTLFSRGVVRLALIALLSGMMSAAWWSFGPQVLRQQMAVADSLISILWCVCGAAGILGAFTGPIARYIGMRQVYRLALVFMAAPLLLMAFSHTFSWWLIPAVALCGAGYITLSGVLLVCGAEATPATPASGVGMVFFMLAVGQVAGAVILGLLYAQAGVALAFGLFALSGLVLLFFTPN
ncbi:MFS transporter [Kosakonia oryziphila]|uniref:Predicted arabinose efflux permease, MFS family n=1 Tax=Kosakonia oryziphila TaxID=1005667 RepID=A0A1C4GBS7_9ENTR|nr:MFS transporter [Kosakonia oryziphila]SCC65265.1 Predicted arabinose efflux permease, MFS family [Kosakonia oryziphila]